MKPNVIIQEIANIEFGDLDQMFANILVCWQGRDIISFYIYLRVHKVDLRGLQIVGQQ